MIAKQRTLTHERAGRILAGTAVLAGLVLAQLISPWFLLAVAATALNLVISAITDRCAVKSLLVKLGLPGERDLGRAEAMASLAEAAPSRPAEATARGAGPRRLAGRLAATIY